MRFGKIELLHDEIGMSLICLDFPTLRRAAEDAVEKPPLRALLNGLALGGRRGRSGSGTSHLLPPSGHSSRTNALSFDLEAAFQGGLKPLHPLPSAHCGEVIAMQERA